MPSFATNSRAAYGAGDRLLHRFALSSRAVLEMSFDIERAAYGKAARGLGRKAPVFVCGLARAGTSLVTRLLHTSGVFASPSYRDMPFPLAPNGWARLTRRADRFVAPTERAHGDGMDHDLDSPEAIEEVLWRCFEGDRYIRPDGLAPVVHGEEMIAALRDYADLVVLRGGRERYLSKANNNILRLDALVKAFPDAVIVHPFRTPSEQAASLREQHVRACDLHRSDPFRRRYMTWLGHHEFGGDQRPFLLPGAPDPAMDRTGADYWLTSWRSVYSHLLDQSAAVRARQLFVDYDALCADPAEMIARIAAAVGVAAGTFDVSNLRPPSPRSAGGTKPANGEDIAYIHGRLKLAAGMQADS